MFNLSDHLRLQKLLSDTIPLLCKNSLGCQLALSVEALIGVTVANESSENGSEVLMVSFKQTVSACGSVKSYAWTELPALTEAVCSNNATLNDKHEVHKVCNDIWKNQSGHKKHVDHESGWHSNDSRFEGCGNDISLRTSYKRGRKRRKMWQDDSRSVCERREAVENSKCVKIENDIDVGAFRDVLLLHETSEGMPEWSEQYGYQESLQEATGNNIEQYDDHESLHEATGMNGTEYADQESQHKDIDINGELSDNLESLHEKATDINGVQYGSMESLHGDASINGEVDSLVNSESLRLAVKGSHQPKVKWSNACAIARGTGKLVKYQNTPAEGSLVQPRVKLIKKAGPRMCTSRVQSRQSEQATKLSFREKDPANLNSPLSDFHCPVFIAPTAGRPNPTKRCRVCYRAKLRREVRYCCGQCPDRPGLCLQPCFHQYHHMMSVSHDKISTEVSATDDGGSVPEHNSEVDATSFDPPM